MKSSLTIYFIALASLVFAGSAVGSMQSDQPWVDLLQEDFETMIAIVHVEDADFGDLYRENGRRWACQRTILTTVRKIHGNAPDTFEAYGANAFLRKSEGQFYIKTTGGMEWLLPGDTILVGLRHRTAYDEDSVPYDIWYVAFSYYLLEEDFSEKSALFNPRASIDKARLKALRSSQEDESYRDMIECVDVAELEDTGKTLGDVYEATK